MNAVDAGSIKAASERLFVAQPALGSQIRQLEDELGVDLLDRHSRGVRPTQAGQILYRKAVAILKDLELTRQEMMALGGRVNEKLTFGVTPGIANVFASEILVLARDLMPTVQFSLTEELSHVMAQAVCRGDVDLALAYEVVERPTLKRSALLLEELAYVVSPSAPFLANIPVRDRREITLAAALEYPLVQAGEGDSTRKLIKDEAQRQSCPFKVVFQASSISAMRGIMLDGKAVGIVPRAIVRDELESGQLEWRRIVQPTLYRTLYLISSENRQPLRAEASIQAFVKAVVGRFSQYQADLIRPIPQGEEVLGQ
ncbi:LysR family nitrogen assimilation transcriptional regulator OS=Castellaniella defragrans OX=75697 GN=HNR28_000906 PE=3 SV=1 [Castellaniella defragrans]